MKITTVCIAIASLCTTTLWAQDLTTHVKDHVYFLANDSLEGRLTGTKGEQIAFAYIAEQYERIGLEPIDGSYGQSFDFVFKKTVGKATSLKINGEEIGTDKYYPLSYAGNGFTSGLIKHAGYGIEAPEKNHNDYENKEVSDNFVVIEISSPDGKHPHSAYINHLDLKTKIDKAREKGAPGIIFVNSDPNAEAPSEELSTTIDPYIIPVLFVKDKSLLPEGAKIEVNIDINVDERTGQNVIGWINNEAPQTVVIGAHYDHLGYGEVGSLYTGNEPAIHNGADDNASGVAAMIELARQLKTNEELALNNYLFIAFSGEELGLYGSSYFVKNPLIDLEQINYMINLDMVGRLDNEGKLAINGVGTSPAITETVEKIEIEGVSATTSASGIGPSDHTSFYLKDVPVVHFFTGTHEDYHKPSDDADLVNYDGIVKVQDYILAMISALNDDGKISFTATKDEENENVPRFTVSLGVIPDYMFDGEGMRIEGVRDGKPADEYGIKDGDIVIKMGAIEVNDMMSYMKGLSQLKKGDIVTVVVLRGQEELSFEVTF